MMVSACLITWKRQENVGRIVDHLLKHDFIDEIIIRDNSKSQNLKCYARYLLADQARNDVVYVQDDDCIVENLQEIYDAFKADPTAIAYGATPDLLRVVKENTHGTAQMCLVGWGAFFKRDWTAVLNKYTGKFGYDYTFYRDADRIFTMLLNRHHNAVPADITHLDGYKDEDAMSSQGDHVASRAVAVERCKQILGV